MRFRNRELVPLTMHPGDSKPKSLAKRVALVLYRRGLDRKVPITEREKANAL